MTDRDRNKTDWSGVIEFTLIICFAIALLLTTGDPDLLDALIKRVMP